MCDGFFFLFRVPLNLQEVFNDMPNARDNSVAQLLHSAGSVCDGSATGFLQHKRLEGLEKNTNQLESFFLSYREASQTLKVWVAAASAHYNLQAWEVYGCRESTYQQQAT